MFKALFGEKYSKAFLDRVEWRKKEYYEKRRIQTIRSNAAKMAMNWTHEYPTGTPLGYIRDDIIEMWERSARVGIFSNLDKKQNIPVSHDTKEAFSTMQAVQTMAEPVRGTRKDPSLQLPRVKKKYAHEWRNPPDEGTND